MHLRHALNNAAIASTSRLRDGATRLMRTAKIGDKRLEHEAAGHYMALALVISFTDERR